MVTKRTTRSSGNYHAPYVHSGHRDYKSIAQHEAEIRQRDNFRYGSYGACALMCAMFVILTLGAVFLGW